jgi:phospholipid/cholesterol/gamma-HCH transport system substrate-binding protein
LHPLLEDFRKTSDEVSQALNHVEAMVGENRADVRQAVVDFRHTLRNMTDATSRIDQTLNVNSENVEELLDNMRLVIENLKEFTSTIKTRLYALFRATNPRQHKPGERQ